jgi:hypothetical protein
MKGIVVDIATRYHANIKIKTEKKEVNITTKSEQAQRFVLPEDTKIVAIKVTPRRWYLRGILASFSNGNVTDESWSCADSSSCQQSFQDCNSSAWKKAEIMTNPPDRPREIASSAKWIWIRESYRYNFWCKRTFGKFKYCASSSSISTEHITHY